MADRKPKVLNRLKTVVKKVKFLLSFNTTKLWLISVMTRTLSSSSSSSYSPRRLSFKASPPGLLDLATDEDPRLRAHLVSRTHSGLTSPVASSSTSSEYSRSSSDASSSSPEDINRKADKFIENFYRHLQMERQVSLKLRYLKDDDHHLKIKSP